MNDLYEEELLRRKIWKKKMLIVGIWFLCTLAFYFAAEYLPPVLQANGMKEKTARLIGTVCSLIQKLSIIVGACFFAKTLHEPLTPKQAEELEERETLEKTGHNQ